MNKNSINNYTEITVNSFAKVDTEVWNNLVSNRFYLRLDYLESLENSVSDISEFLYTVYYNGTEAIGISIFQKLQLDLSTYQYKDVQWKISTDLLRKFVKKKVGLLMCGNIFATGENIYSFKPEISQQEIFERIHHCVENTLKCNDKISYVILKEYSDTSEATKLLQDTFHYHSLHINDLMTISLDKGITSMDNYCQQFTAKYRTRANKVRKRSVDLVCKEFNLSEIETHAKRIEYLYNEVLKKSSFNIGVFNYKTFYNLKENLKDQYRFFGYFHEDKLIGFKTLFHFNNIVDASFIGIDYEANAKYDTYQRILMDYVEFSIEENADDLYLGRTAETIKSCIGAEPHKMNLFIKHRSPIGCFILNMLIKFIKPQEKQIRKPFKKKIYS
jgi:hypothetical protein